MKRALPLLATLVALIPAYAASAATSVTVDVPGPLDPKVSK